jgi:hypothetical protein
VPVREGRARQGAGAPRGLPQATGSPPCWKHFDARVDGLLALDAAERDTTLLVLPQGFDEFLLFLDLVREGERLVRKRGWKAWCRWRASIRASCSPAPIEDDIGQLHNRAPYPTLHLLREESIDRAVAAFPDAASDLRAPTWPSCAPRPEGWAALGVGPA